MILNLLGQCHRSPPNLWLTHISYIISPHVIVHVSGTPLTPSLFRLIHCIYQIKSALEFIEKGFISLQSVFFFFLRKK